MIIPLICIRVVEDHGGKMEYGKDDLNDRIRLKQTNLKKLLLAAALGDEEARAFLTRETAVQVPDKDLGLRELGQVALECSTPTWMRLALVCAEAQFKLLPGCLKRGCREMIDQAHACLAVPSDDERIKRLRRLRCKVGDKHVWWLGNRYDGSEKARREAEVFMGIGLGITCVLENLGKRTAFLIATPDLILQYVDTNRAHAQFFRLAKRDFIPWLKGNWPEFA